MGMTREQAIKIIERVDICANAAETARDMAIAALKEPVLVRCKDCKHWTKDGNGYSDDESYCGNPNGLDNYAHPDDFCSYGERREGE